jgi:glycosyltransferase involved in cell wall biosynthesis
MLRVTAIPADKAGCGQYRMRMPAAAVNHLGLAEVTLTDRVVPDKVLEEADVVVVQRPLRKLHYDFVEWLREEGMAVVVEIDDNCHQLWKKHPLEKDIVHTAHPEKMSSHWLAKTCEIATLVTVTTPALADLYGAHGRVEIIDNYLPAERIVAGIEHKKRHRLKPRAVVGYSGPAHFHLPDLREVGKGILQAQQRRRFDFYGIGSIHLPNHFRVDGTATEWAELLDYSDKGYVAHQARIDIGLVPLMRCAFNQAKSTLKGKEYASLGIPFIASPTDPYLDLAEQGIGVIARTPAEWRERLLELLDDPTPRADYIEWAATQTLEPNAWRWVNAWEKARASV